MIAYFLPMKPGAHKVYSTPENSFWCCVGSGFENQAKYGEFIYYHDNKGLYVNLFIPSELNWKEKGIVVKQQTNFPNLGNTQLTLSTANPVSMPISIRYPSWAANAEVKINGKKANH
ncbi:beta-L-arabinofuranosidase domain-containing protein [Flavobacterium commune]|uniref:beta-L-arabinofuranosidase domain-containing protein n=1 Tax=Flavobacterium commune TaxID=1306519 RepID=UPI000A4CA1B6|nr:beta-L-arabinofuranosidase domain-containing protein [Flavobacterium commune]